MKRQLWNYFPNETDRYYSDQIISFQVQAADMEDNPEELTVTWDSSLDGTLSLEAQPDSTGFIDDAGYYRKDSIFSNFMSQYDGKICVPSLVLDVGGETPSNL